MPEATTTYATIKQYCQDATQDTTDKFWDSTAWLREINRVTLDILNAIRSYRAYSLCDLLLDSVDISGDGTGSYDWHAAIEDASKTYYFWTKVTVNDDEYDLSRVSHLNWHNATRGFVATSANLGLWTIGKDGKMYTCPDFTSSDTIHFWFVKTPTALVENTDKPDIDETLIDMYELGAGKRYARMRGMPKKHAMFSRDWELLKRERIKPFGATKIIRVKTTKGY